MATYTIHPFWIRTRQLPLIWGGVLMALALVAWLTGTTSTRTLVWLSIAAAAMACSWAWRHRRLVDQEAPPRALFLSWAVAWVLCSNVLLLSGWVRDHRWGWAQIAFHLAMIFYAWTETREGEAASR